MTAAISTGRGIVIVSPPAICPVSLLEVKRHVRAVDFDDDDEMLALYLKAATNNAETFTGRAFIDQIIDYYVDSYPTNGSTWIELPKPPLIEMIGVFGGETEYPADSYVLDTASRKARIGIPSGGSWPQNVAGSLNAMRVRYRAGYVVDPEESPTVHNVPSDIKAAILLEVGHLYANRESVNVGNIVTPLPLAWEHLLRPYRVHLALA